MNDKKMKRKKISGLLLFFMAAISFLHSDPQILSKEDITVYKDIVYSVADGHELKLDIAVPKYLRAPAPAIVDIPGGSWRVVNKSVEDALFYAKYGFIGVSVTHRTSDIAVFPAAVHDWKADLARLANPIMYIDPEDPPVFIGHGEKDGMVIIYQSELLHEALRRAGVPTEFVRVKNADHMYRPFKWDAEISPSISEMNRMTIEWFQKWLGKPKLDTNRIPSQKSKPAIQSSKETPLYYRLTIELPGKTEKSYCRGRFMVRGGEEFLAQGNIEMKDLSSAEKRTFQKDFMIAGSDLTGEEIMWNFQGEIFDSELDEKFEIMYMQGEKYEPFLEGFGYYIRINKDKTAGIEKKVFRKKN